MKIDTKEFTINDFMALMVSILFGIGLFSSTMKFWEKAIFAAFFLAGLYLSWSIVETRERESKAWLLHLEKEAKKKK